VGNVEFNFAGKSVLVTGASKGIGRGIAEAFGRAGASVALNYRSDEEGAAEAARRIEASGGRSLVVQADVADPSAVADLFEAIDRELGPLDILVNNAGQAGPDKPLHEVTPEEWQDLLAANLDGAFYCAPEAARRMLARGQGGRIVNITSVHEEATNVPGQAPYNSSKAALRNMTRTMALELGPHGITVNAVAPGMILTPMNGRALEDPAYLAEAEAQIPARRAGVPEDIAGMVLYLSTDLASYCTGATYFVDGGWLLTRPAV
jgi:NAD(P)-dependent dehydrogenase (short-subunit alcohol dehydrogenase family)